MNNIFELDKEYIANTYSRFPLEIVSGKGSVAEDGNGKKYIDMGAGIAVNTFGFADEQLIKAIDTQLRLFSHTSNLYYSSPCVTLARMLCERTGMKKAFFSNSGAEANECAIKAARKYAAQKKGGGCCNIITLVNSFHGRTVTTLSATGQEVFHQDFKPLTPGFVYARANDIEDLKEKISASNPAAIMFETVQGEGGVIPLEKTFTDEMARIAKENDILLIADEVQTGNGRCGKLYAYMNYGLSPDIVSTAKGLAGGLPIGATMLGEKVKDVFTPGSHGSTFGGNPVCCAAAANVISRIDGELLSSVNEKSKYIVDELSDSKGIRSVTGMGLMLGIETEKNAKEIAAKCLDAGVLVLTAKEKIRLLPALNIPENQLKEAIGIIKKICAED